MKNAFTTRPHHKRNRRKRAGQLHFDMDELGEIFDFFKHLLIVKVEHDEQGAKLQFKSGEHIHIADDEVRISRHPSDDLIKASAELTKARWGGEVAYGPGSEELKIRYWAYDTAAGNRVTNYTPQGASKLKAEQLLAQIRAEQAAPHPATFAPPRPAAPAPRPS